MLLGFYASANAEPVRLVFGDAAINGFTSSNPGLFGATLTFHMTGYLVVNGSAPIEITGLGVARYLWVNDGDGYDLGSIFYNFESGAEPTPEPATLLLLGIGLTGLASYSTRKRWKNE